MTAARDAFLQQVRQSVQAGNQTGHSLPLPERAAIGYQGAGSHPSIRFREELAAAGGQAHLVADREAAIDKVLDIVQTVSARHILLGRGPFLDSLQLANYLRARGVEVTCVDQLKEETCRESFFAADLGITGVDHLIAETGTIVLRAQPDQPRSVSLLPPVHIAVAEISQLLPDLFDLFAAESGKGPTGLPSCLNLITGPSKTGDIELNLVTGVHGPGQLHVVLVG
jgi:L-lactate utilization protein LutC